MNAYIETNVSNGHWTAQVVTTQDYRDGGPFAHSYRSTGEGLTRETAIADAEDWCKHNGITIVSPNDLVNELHQEEQPKRREPSLIEQAVIAADREGYTGRDALDYAIGYIRTADPYAAAALRDISNEIRDELEQARC